MDAVLATLARQQIDRLFVYTDREAGLRAFLVIDDVRLGPAAGGIRTARYPDANAAIADAAALARAMTMKCSIAGLPAGGGKMVVMDHPGLDRDRAFRILGRRIEELGGLFVTAGDLGTTAADLGHVASQTQYVRTNTGDLAEAVALGLRGCLNACATLAGRSGITGLRVAVQGCGAIGSAVAALLHADGATLLVSDLDSDAATAVAAKTGAQVVDPDRLLTADVDILAPCAIGGVITPELVPQLGAWAVCGAANNVLASASTADLLAAHDITLVPDIIGSAGAVIRGICAIQHRDDEMQLIGQLEHTAREVIETAQRDGLSVVEVANATARRRLRGTAG